MRCNRFQVVLTIAVTILLAAPAAKEAPVYLLQVGSFSKAADAERLKAQLALLGFEASVNRVKTDRGVSYNRVRVGPFQGAAALKSAQSRLAANGMKSLVIKFRN